MGAPPPAYEVDEQAVAQAQAEAEARSGGGDGTIFFKFPPPQGFSSWKSAPANTSVTINTWFCQPAPGQRRWFHSYKKHKYNYHEGGSRKFSSIECIGDGCLFCQAIELAKQYPNLADSVENWGGPPSSMWLFNVLMLDYPQQHLKADGVTMEPMILDVGPQLANQILAMVSPAGLGNTGSLVDPYHGRPARLTRKKTGDKDFDVDYSATYAPNPSPLPQIFYGAMHHLHDLSRVRKTPSAADYQKAIMRLGWPMPQGASQAPAAPPPQQAPYNPAPQPPYPNPYELQQPPPPQQQQPYPQQPYQQPPPATPQQAAPPPVPPYQTAPSPPPAAGPGAPPPYPTQAPPPPPSADPRQAAPPPPSGMVPPPPPNAPPPPPGAAPLPQQQAAPPGPPPPMNPPPQTAAVDPHSPYGPPPAPVPGQGDNVPFEQPTAPTGQPARSLILDPETGALPQGIQLEGGRERCFGQHDSDSMMCRNCPDDVKRQCVAQSGDAAPPPPSEELAALQAKLEGAM